MNENTQVESAEHEASSVSSSQSSFWRDRPTFVTGGTGLVGGWLVRRLPGTIRSILRGERPVIRSDGNFVRDYFYVEDGAAVYTLLAEKLAEQPELSGQASNFSYEIQMTVLELTEMITRLMDSDLQPEIRNEASNEIRAQYLSAEKARRELNWSPLFTMNEGLKNTIEWYRGFLGDAA